jgi:PiT family inorganic phosphate transporter
VSKAIEYWWFLAISLAVSFYLALNIGANDLANAMGTSVGSKALSVRNAVIIASVLNLVGAVLVGSRVTHTVRKDIIDLGALGGDDTFNWTVLLGLLAAMLAAAIWINIATYFHLPVSTTHAIVGAMIGFGIAAGGIAVVNWPMVGKIAASWVISPIAGAMMALVTFMLIRKAILTHPHPFKQALKFAPFLVGLVMSILAIAMLIEALEPLHLGYSYLEIVLIGLAVGVLASIPAYLLFKRYKMVDMDEYKKVERIFIPLQIITAGYVAFAHGSNDVANAIAPLTGIVAQLVYGTPEDIPMSTIMVLLAFGGIGIAIGTAVWGRGVMKTIGERITEITPTRGFTAEFSAATTVLACSLLGLPISTTHTLVGAVIGVGLAGGVAAVDGKVIKNIIYSWVITVPFAGILCGGIFLVLNYIS